MIRRNALGQFRRATVYELAYEAERRHRERMQQSLIEPLYSESLYRLILMPTREEALKMALDGLNFQPFVGFPKT